MFGLRLSGWAGQAITEAITRIRIGLDIQNDSNTWQDQSLRTYLRQPTIQGLTISVFWKNLLTKLLPLILIWSTWE